MVHTLELPIRKTAISQDPLAAYASRFGCLPEWFTEISLREARFLARKSLRIGVPLSPAEYFSF